MDNATQHNLTVAFNRMWSAIAAHQLVKETAGPVREIAIELYQFEARRFETALFALSTTSTESN